MKEEVPEQKEDSILEEPVVEEPKKVKKEIVKVKEKAQSGIELVLDIYMQYNAIEASHDFVSVIIFVRFHFSSFFQNHIENGTNLLRLLFWDEIQIYNM